MAPKQLWTVDPHDHDIPEHVRKAIMKHGRELELTQESHFYVDPEWTHLDEMSEAEKTLVKYIEEELKVSPDEVLFFYWW